jgi:uncharacterized protein YecE (DUF72 family)
VARRRGEGAGGHAGKPADMRRTRHRPAANGGAGARERSRADDEGPTHGAPHASPEMPMQPPSHVVGDVPAHSAAPAGPDADAPARDDQAAAAHAALRAPAAEPAAPSASSARPSDTPPQQPGQLTIFGDVSPAVGSRRAARADGPVGPAATPLALPDALAPYAGLLRLGTSSWSFPGWQGLVYEAAAVPFAESRLSREGLPAYAAHPLLGAVGIDRGFYAPLAEEAYAQYASQVPQGFRFLVKAPGLVTDAVRRDATGRGRETNPDWLDAGLATACFVAPAVRGLGERLGTLLFQFSPLPAALLADTPAWTASLQRFLRALPRALPPGAAYAVELRDPALLTPRLMDVLRDEGVGYCVGLHDRMPPVDRQLRALDRLERDARGPLTVRWTLHAGIGYEAARERYAPFRELLDPDPRSRDALAARAAQTLLAGQPVTVIANNKAEGSAPLTLAALAAAIAARL